MVLDDEPGAQNVLIPKMLRHAVQFADEEAPPKGLKRPTGQGDVTKEPAGQNEPAVHCWHALTPDATLNVPAGHGCGVGECASQKVPAGHTVCVSTPAAQ